MPFFSGAKTLSEIIELIADTLVGYANWEDGDTTWVTTFTGNCDDLGRRSLKYTGDSAPIWLALENLNANITRYSDDSHTNYRYKGLRLTFSASWDSIGHSYPSNAYEDGMTFIPFEGDDDAQVPHMDLSVGLLTYYLWVDSSGFALMAVPEANSLDDRQSSFICVVEHMGNKEYSDGLTNFYLYCRLNTTDSWADANRSDHVAYRHWTTVRPFAYRGKSEAGMQFWSDKWYALKSTGNGKVYFVKPVICNDADETIPIYQSEMFFRFSPDSGLVDGDVIAVENATTKYICKTLQSPDSSATLYYAIKYVA